MSKLTHESTDNESERAGVAPHTGRTAAKTADVRSDSQSVVDFLGSPAVPRPTTPTAGEPGSYRCPICGLVRNLHFLGSHCVGCDSCDSRDSVWCSGCGREHSRSYAKLPSAVSPDPSGALDVGPVSPGRLRAALLRFPSRATAALDWVVFSAPAGVLVGMSWVFLSGSTGWRAFAIGAVGTLPPLYASWLKPGPVFHAEHVVTAETLIAERRAYLAARKAAGLSQHHDPLDGTWGTVMQAHSFD